MGARNNGAKRRLRVRQAKAAEEESVGKNSEKDWKKATAEEDDNIDDLARKVHAPTKDNALLKDLKKATAEEDDNFDDLTRKVDATTKENVALKNQIDVLTDQLQQVVQVMTLLETSTTVSDHDRQVLKSVAGSSENMAMGNQDGYASGHSFKGGDLIDVLKNLRLKLQGDVTDTQNCCDLAKRARNNVIDVADAPKHEKEDLEGEVVSQQSQASEASDSSSSDSDSTSSSSSQLKGKAKAAPKAKAKGKAKAAPKVKAMAAPGCQCAQMPQIAQAWFDKGFREGEQRQQHLWERWRARNAEAKVLALEASQQASQQASQAQPAPRKKRHWGQW